MVQVCWEENTTISFFSQCWDSCKLLLTSNSFFLQKLILTLPFLPFLPLKMEAMWPFIYFEWGKAFLVCCHRLKVQEIRWERQSKCKHEDWARWGINTSDMGKQLFNFRKKNHKAQIKTLFSKKTVSWIYYVWKCLEIQTTGRKGRKQLVVRTEESMVSGQKKQGNQLQGMAAEGTALWVSHDCLRVTQNHLSDCVKWVTYGCRKKYFGQIVMCHV